MARVFQSCKAVMHVLRESARNKTRNPTVKTDEERNKEIVKLHRRGREGWTPSTQEPQCPPRRSVPSVPIRMVALYYSPPDPPLVIPREGLAKTGAVQLPADISGAGRDLGSAGLGYQWQATGLSGGSESREAATTASLPGNSAPRRARSAIGEIPRV